MIPHPLTRRDFLTRMTAGATGAALGTVGGLPLVLQRALASGGIGLPDPSGRVRKLLFIFLRGANDGLNSLIPYGDDAYSPVNRPTLHVAADPAAPSSATGVPAYFPESGPDRGTFHRDADTLLGGLALGNGFAGLHPSLKFAIPAFNAGDVALIHRVGYPDQSRSHFDSQNYWETGAPRDETVRDGILYRAMVESGLANTNPLTAVSFQSSLPLLLRGSKAAMTNISDPGRYGLLGVPENGAADSDAKAKRFLKLAEEARFADKRSRNLLDLQYENLSNTLDIFASINFDEQFVDQEVTDGDRPYSLFPVSAATNGGYAAHGNDPDKYVVPPSAYGFFERLRSAALVLNKTDAIVAGTQISGWDTHSTQGTLTGSHPNLLRQVGWAVHALRKYFLQHPEKCRWEDLLVVTLSEFGRTTVENDDNGTDHAEAGVMLVAGGNVRGRNIAAGRTGIHGCDPADPVPWQTGQTGSMFQAERRYLQRCIDYRSVLGRILRNHLGASPEQLGRIIPGYVQPGEHLQAGGVQSVDGVRITGEPDIV